MYLFWNAASPLSFIRVFFDNYCTVVILATDDSAAFNSAVNRLLCSHTCSTTVSSDYSIVFGDVCLCACWGDERGESSLTDI